MSPQALPYVAMLGFLFGSTLVASRFSVGQFQPSTYIGLRLSLAGTAHLLTYARVGGRFRWPRDGRLWRRAVLLGVLGTIALISITMGNLVYILEPDTFKNAFEGTWWSLVTMSTVGYGDFVPQTPLGRIIAAGLIMSGICMFAMVTAVVSVRVGRMVHNAVRCERCNHGISPDYDFCPHCALPQQAQEEPLTPEEDGL